MFRAFDDPCYVATDGRGALQQKKHEGRNGQHQQSEEDVEVPAGGGRGLIEELLGGGKNHLPVRIRYRRDLRCVFDTGAPTEKVAHAPRPSTEGALPQREAPGGAPGGEQVSVVFTGGRQQDDAAPIRQRRMLGRLGDRIELFAFHRVGLGHCALAVRRAAHQVDLDMVAQSFEALVQCRGAQVVERYQAQADGLGEKSEHECFRRTERSGLGGGHRVDGDRRAARREGPIAQLPDGAGDGLGALRGEAGGRARDEVVAMPGGAKELDVQQRKDRRHEHEGGAEQGAASQRVPAGTDALRLPVAARGRAAVVRTPGRVDRFLRLPVLAFEHLGAAFGG